MRRLKTAIAITGIVLAILGWYAKGFERYPRVITLLAPHYADTLGAYETMLVSASPAPDKRVPTELTRKDRGFHQLLLVLANDFADIKNTSSVVKMRIKDVGLAIGAYNTLTGSYYSGAQPHFGLTLKEGKRLSKYVNDLRPKIRKHFLDDEIFFWSSCFFWVGIVLSVLSLFIPTSPSNK
jgi:hypothetical protein